MKFPPLRTNKVNTFPFCSMFSSTSLPITFSCFTRANGATIISNTT